MQAASTGAEGYFCLLLHAHLPYIRHPEHSRFLEESWFFEAMTETYLPLLLAFEELERDAVEFRAAWSLTPTLLSMFDDELLRDRYQRHLESLIQLAEKEAVRQRHHRLFRETAEFYLQRFRHLFGFYVVSCRRDLTAAFRRLQDKGLVEILASAATHGYLPLLRHEPSSVRAQVLVAVDHYRAAFGRDPQGMWLPECGYYPGLDELLAEAGLRYFCLETHGVLNGSTRARDGVHAPVICPSGVAAFARDPETTRQVWSSQDGFPGDPDYREFYWDIGYELPLDYIGPYVGPDGVRIPTGIKYHRVTGRTDDKQPYEREAAKRKAALHAAQFLEWRIRQVEWLKGRMDRRPFILAPYDAELFGHWWFEGPEWIQYLLRKMAFDQKTVLAVAPSEYLAEYPEGQLSTPSASSWGHKGHNEVWLNGGNDWLYPRLHRAAAEMADLAFRRRGARGLEERFLDQAARELLLAQASDWSFILKTRTATGYAIRRTCDHLDNFQRLAGALRDGPLDEALVAGLEARNNIFPRLSYRVFEDVPPRPAHAIPRQPRHVALLTAEMAPLVKVGGLADVAGALPAALAACGARVTVILPAYRSIDQKKHGIRLLRRGVPAGARGRAFDLLEGRPPAPGVRLLLIEDEELFGREGVYVDPKTKSEYPDTAARFASFTRAALESLRLLGEPVDIVHSHDHQTALASAYLKIQYRDDPVLGRAGAVYTLHNLGYQGVYGPEVLEVAGFGRDQFYPGSPFEHEGSVNWMKAGISFADKVSTVSRTYAREICEDPIQGAGLGEILRRRRRDLAGILNGIDVNEWNPAGDPFIPRPFDAAEIEGKLDSKRELLRRAGLDETDLEGPVAGMITRLVDQKGLDLLADGLEQLLETGLRLIVLGTGLEKYEKLLSEAEERFAGRMKVLLRFDNAMAHLIEAGSDLFLMPSLYEPCGLNQMYSLRYGTVPVVRATGGLADTVSDADATPDGVGFTFQPYTVEAFLDAVARALKAHADPERWRAIQHAAMTRNNSWAVSAGKYLELYRGALARAGG
jgi:1,4-alpha-glucan branching enzyme